LDAAIATDEGLVLFMNSNSNDGDFPINNGGQDLWVSKFINSDTICLTFANTSFETCPQDSFLLNPFISGCENCSYTWEDNSTNINRWVDAQTSDTFILNISNGINIDTIINIELLISQLTNLEYDIEYIGDCPGEEVKIKFDTSTCNGCIIKENFRPLDTNVISLYPLKDEIAVFNLQLGSCFSKFEIPLDIYDFEARVKHSFCGDSNSLEVLPIGGNGNININWEDGSTDFIRNDLEPGFHSFTLSDSLCSIGDSTTQSQFLIPFADFAFSTKPLDSSGFNYFISTEEEYIDLNTTLYNYFLVKAKEGVVFDFAKIVVHPYWEFFNIDIIDNKIHVKELEYGNRNYIFDFDLSLLDSSIPQNPIRINYFENKVSRIENGDTLWTQSFENRINNFAINTDSSELIVCGREILKFVNYNSGEVLLTRDVGGSNYENITAVKIREGRIFGVGTTNSNDGDLLNVNLDDSLSTKLWIFEIDRSQNFKWQYLIDQGASANLHLFKEGLLVTVGGKTYRFSSEGQFVWSYNEKMFLRSVEDTIIFDSRIFYDTFDESRIFRDSLNLDQDSTISVNSIPGSNILWSTGDTTSTITVSDPGTYTVQIESPDGCVTLDTIIVFARSVANYELDLKDYEIQVYPNPNNGEFIVESEAKIQSIRIVNAMGKVMQQVQFPIGVNNHRINLDNDFTGLYILQCRINNSWHSKKIITMNQ
jgi:hypothetical protein